MKEMIKTFNEKQVEIPARMFTKKDLEKMELDFISNKIFFNKAKPYKDFPEVSDGIIENMGIMNYTDCSNIPFSLEVLKDSVNKQINSESDFVIFPYFRNESDFDVKTKIDFAEKLKLKNMTEKEFILEVSYKSTISMKELSDLSHNFDYLSIFYGVPYGHFPSFAKLIKKVVLFKALANKKVLCMAVPLKFSGEDNKDCRLMPCFNFVADIWIRNWRKAGGNDKIKVVDQEDLKSKDYEEWLESGHRPDQQLQIINNRTVYDLFRKDSQEIREEYRKLVYDVVFNEMDNITPVTFEDYIYQKFYSQYCVPLIFCYKEKIIAKLFRANPIFKIYNKSELELLEGVIRRKYSPLIVQKLIMFLEGLIQKDKNIPITKLIKNVDNFQIY